MLRLPEKKVIISLYINKIKYKSVLYFIIFIRLSIFLGQKLSKKDFARSVEQQLEWSLGGNLGLRNETPVCKGRYNTTYGTEVIDTVCSSKEGFL